MGLFGALRDAFTRTGATRAEPDKKGFTISSPAGQQSGVTISTGGDGSFNIYRDSRDPDASSSIATKEARTGIAKGGLANIIASTDIEDKQEPEAAPTTVIPAGSTITNLPSMSDTMLNPEGRIMPSSEDVRQQNILQSTYAPRPKLDLISGRPIQYDDAFFKSGSDRADPKFDTNVFLDTIGIDRPVPPVPEGDVFERRFGMTFIKQPSASNYSTILPEIEQPDLEKVNQFVISKGFNPENVVVLENKLYDRSSGALLDLPDFTDILELTK